jgi:hypothetical protein
MSRCSRLALAALLLCGCKDSTPPTLDRNPLADGPFGEQKPGFDRRTEARPGEGRLPDSRPGPVSNCGALAAPTGTIVKVTPAEADKLPSLVYSAAAGTTILLEDGTYKMTGSDESQRRLTIANANISIRSASGNRDKVIIDGEYTTFEIISIQAPNVTIADLTLQHATDHLIHLVGAPVSVIKSKLHNLHLIDSGEQFVKVNSDGNGNFVDEGILQCSLLEMTADGRTHVQPDPGGCYTGGIDAHGAWKWIVRENTFTGIHCENGSLAEHAIHFWSESRDTLIERNKIIDCARGVGVGLGETGATRTYSDNPYSTLGYKGHIDGIVRDNVIHAGTQASPYFDTGIEIAQAPGIMVYHNTVVTQPLFSSIDYRWSNTDATIRNNLTFKITSRDGAKGTADHNLESTPSSLFAAPASADYHLVAGASAAIDKGAVLSPSDAGGLDLDGYPHDATPDLGAFEYRP